MSAGILRNWHLSKIKKASNPVEYYFALQELAVYEMNIFIFNINRHFDRIFDK